MEKNQLARSIGLSSSIAVVAGGVIGSGIFMKPALMASQLGSPVMLLGVWLIAGIITLFGALTNAEVAAMLPQTGGQYVFFQKMYGDFFAFLYGWAAFAVFNTAGVASIAYVLAQYVEYFVHLPRFSPAIEHAWVLHLPFVGDLFPLENFGVKAITMLVVIGLTVANYMSTRVGSGLQVVVTSLNIAAILLLVCGIFFSGKGSVSHFFTSSSVIHPRGIGLLNAFVAATAGAFWAYDGWNNITFVAGEIKNPQKNIPRSLFIGLTGAILVYAAINQAYLYVLPIDKVAGSRVVASDAAAVVMGSAGGAFIALLVIISTFGTTNANVLATARVSFAMARENRFFDFAGRIHPRFKTPGNALWLHCVWTCLLVCSGSFDMLTDMLIFVSFLFYGMSALGVFILRRRWPQVQRPYKVWGYPVVPAVFVLFAAFFLFVTLYNDIGNYVSGRSHLINSVFGLILTAIGMPLYWYFKRRKTVDEGL